MPRDYMHSRRSYLKTAGAASMLGVAGCIGGDDVTRVTMGTPPSGTTSQQTMSALQRAVDNTSDTVDLRLEETAGNVDQIRLFNQDEFDGYNAARSTVTAADQSIGAFEENPVEEVGSQSFVDLVFHFYFIAVEGTGIETFDDVVEGDGGVYLLQPGFGFRDIIIEILEGMGVFSDIEDRLVNVDVGEAAGAVDEGRIDSLFVYSSNWQTLPGWLTEVDTRAEVKVIEATPELIQGYEEHPAGPHEVVEPYGWQQDVGDEVDALNSPNYVMFGDDVPNEAVKEICRVTREENDAVREAMESYLDHTEDEFMTGALDPSLKVHEGAKEYYDEENIDYPS